VADERRRLPLPPDNVGRVTSIRTPGGGLTGARLAQIGLKFLF
jgi:hypothetical protein